MNKFKRLYGLCLWALNSQILSRLKNIESFRNYESCQKNQQKIISKLQGGSDRSFITSITKGIGLNI